MKKFLFLIVFYFLVVPIFSQTKKFTQEDSLRGTNSKERSCYDVHYYELSIAVDMNLHRIKGSNTIYFIVKEDFLQLQLDLFKNMSIIRISDDKDSALTYTRKGDAIVVKYKSIQRKGNRLKIKVDYEGEPKAALDAPWDGGFVWSKDSLGRPWLGVACEGVGASLWWPCKDHPSDEPDSMKLSVEVPEELTCISNGNVTKVGQTARGTKIYEWSIHYPINLYNITLNIGHYAHFSDSFEGVADTFSLDYYVLSYNLAKAKIHFEQVKKIMACYEKLFGKYPYPRDGYALVETSYWGMEHQSAISYGNHYRNNLVDQLDYIIVHESGHEWWGNNVTAADHAELWIHEAFTTYGESLLLECMYSPLMALAHLEKQKKTIKNKERILGPEGVNYHYWEDSDMYYKGAWMLHTLRSSVNNDSLWFALFPALQKNFASKQVSTKEIITYINSFLGFNYGPFFMQYLKYTNLPVLEYRILKNQGTKIQYQYRWKTDVKDFVLPIYKMTKEGKKERILLSNNFRTDTFLVGEKKTGFPLDERFFYVQLKPIQKTK